MLGNVGPDEPFGGGVPDVDFDAADPDYDGPGDAIPRRTSVGARSDNTPAIPGPASHCSTAGRNDYTTAGTAREEVRYDADMRI